MEEVRRYTMRQRATAHAATRTAILNAVLELAGEMLTMEITLEDVAARAGVSTRTVLRHFRSRDGLFDALEVFARDALFEERPAPVGDVAAAVRVLVAHYEVRGDMTVLVIGQESTDARSRHWLDFGRRVHREWVQRVFEPELASRTKPEPIVQLLIVATDVLVWKLLRRDAGLGQDTTQARMLQLVQAVLAEPEV